MFHNSEALIIILIIIVKHGKYKTKTSLNF